MKGAGAAHTIPRLLPELITHRGPPTLDIDHVAKCIDTTIRAGVEIEVVIPTKAEIILINPHNTYKVRLCESCL